MNNLEFSFFEKAIKAGIANCDSARAGPTRQKKSAGEKPSNADETFSQSFSLSSAEAIIKKCATLRHFHAVRGNVGEPLWRAALGVLKFAENGQEICHEWSAGHPDYSQAETQGKIDRWKTNPTRCETFRSMTDSKCSGCGESCKSPIQLGREVHSSDQIREALEVFNDRYFVARVGGKTLVFDEQSRPILASGMSFASFRDFMASTQINNTKTAPIWLSWINRRTYEGLVFEPSGQNKSNEFNTWIGFAIEPRQGSCGLILNHIEHVLCGGNQAQFKYVLNWMSHLVQRPGEKPEVALVIRANEGAGKTIVTDILLKIFGPHGLTAQHKDQVAGRFNGHLFDKVLVVLEEAFFAGDPAAIAAIKVLVTNSSISYEAKGKDPFSAKNHAHVITLTNHDWAVPVGNDSRRWMVLDVSEARRRDHTYFSALSQEINNGGTEALLDHLLGVDLTGFNPRALPASKAFAGQLRETLQQRDPVAAWWLHCLAEGAFPVDGDVVEWAEEIPVATMSSSYDTFTKKMRHAPSWFVAAKKLRDLAPPISRQRHSRGNHRLFSYHLPPLEEARAFFQKKQSINPTDI